MKIAQEPTCPVGISSEHLIAGPMLIAGAGSAAPAAARPPAAGVDPTTQLPVDDLRPQRPAQPPRRRRARLITVVVNPDGTVSFALPAGRGGAGHHDRRGDDDRRRDGHPAGQGQGHAADARPELVFNQLTGGSNSMHSIYTPVRRGGRHRARPAAKRPRAVLGGTSVGLRLIRDGVDPRPRRTARRPRRAGRAGRGVDDHAGHAQLKPHAATDAGRHTPEADRRPRRSSPGASSSRWTSTSRAPCRRWSAGRRRSTARPARSATCAQVKAMPGITDVAIIPHTQFVPGGVAVRARPSASASTRSTRWTSLGPGLGRRQVRRRRAGRPQGGELPLTPALPAGQDDRADVHVPLPPRRSAGDQLRGRRRARADSAEIWSSLKSPIWAQEQIAQILGLPPTRSPSTSPRAAARSGATCSATPRSRRRDLAEARQAGEVDVGIAPTTSARAGCTRCATSRVRVTYAGGNVLSLRPAPHERGHRLHAGPRRAPHAQWPATLPGGELRRLLRGRSSPSPRTCPTTSARSPSCSTRSTTTTRSTPRSVRNIYSPDVCTATELMVDQLGAGDGHGPATSSAARSSRDPRCWRCWTRSRRPATGAGRCPPAPPRASPSTASTRAGRPCLVEIDCRPATVNRKIREAYTGPRVTKVVFVVDVGLPINPLGLEAQMMGGIMDGIAQALTYSLHLQDGHFLEGSWDNAYYTRQWNTPPELEVIVMPPTTEHARRRGRARGRRRRWRRWPAPTRGPRARCRPSFPINHNQPLGFTPYPDRARRSRSHRPTGSSTPANPP